MTVQDALERAKQMAKARRQAERPQPAVHVPVQPLVLPVPPAETVAGAEPKQAYAPAEVRLRPFPKFATSPYDIDRCIQNRVLIPEASPHGEALGAAAYRILRARLLQRVRVGNWSAVGLTSPGTGEGKSLTAVNLALAIAAERINDVFLLDLDLRSPSIARYLGVQPPVDIAEYLSGAGNPDAVLFSIGVDNLTLAGSLNRNERASELLAAGRLFELLNYIRSTSARPLVIVDMPPLLSTDDALVVAPQLEAMLLVVGEGRTRRDGLERAMELMAEFNLAGVVLNRSRESVQAYYGAPYGAT